MARYAFILAFGTGTMNPSTYIECPRCRVLMQRRASALRKHPFELVERAGPALLMAIARRLVEEQLVQQRQDGAVAVRLECDGDLRLALRRGLPVPGEDEPFVRHDLAIDAEHVMP